MAQDNNIYHGSVNSKSTSMGSANQNSLSGLQPPLTKPHKPTYSCNYFFKKELWFHT